MNVPKLTVDQIEEILESTGMTEEKIFEYIDKVANIEEKEDMKLSEAVKNMLSLKASKKILKVAGIDYEKMSYWDVKTTAMQVLVVNFLPVENLQQG